MTTEIDPVIEQAQIEKIVEHWKEAIRSKDLNARMSNYAPNVSLFDVVKPFQYVGSDAVRKRATEWFSSFEGPLDFDMCDLRIATDNDTAFSHSLNHVLGTKKDGQAVDMWWRSTVCFRKMDEQWMVTHEHNSLPFDVQTGKASLNLKP